MKYCIYFGNLIGIAFTLSLICREKFVLSNLRSPYYVIEKLEMSRVMRKQTFCICENKDADQLRGNREADQRLCFRYIDSFIPSLYFLNPNFQASSHLL